MYDLQTLDIYDDQGAMLRQFGVTSQNLPDFVKTAATVNQDYNGNCFALVLVDEGKSLKKFATYDAGNTWLSGVYFEETRRKLPEGAVKVAAQNLMYAFEQYGLQAPEAMVKAAGDISVWPPTSNVYTGPSLDVEARTVVVKHESQSFAIEKTANASAYPIDSPEQVKKAQAYFDENAEIFSPAQRREYAVNVRDQAGTYGLPVSEKVAQYSGSYQNPFLQSYITRRDVELASMESPPETRKRLEKLAAQAHTMPLDLFANELEAIDKEAGLDALWGAELPDPWLSTFSTMNKVASKRWTVGLVEVNESQVRRLAGQPERMSEVFGSDFMMKFMKNPVVVFDTLPLGLKETVARMAVDVAVGY